VGKIYPAHWIPALWLGNVYGAKLMLRHWL
jgi:hypothetical protein